MADSTIVAAHYTHGSLLDAIRAGVTKLGKTPESVTVDDLAAKIQNMIANVAGGRPAPVELIARKV